MLVEREGERFISRNWLTRLWGLASLKYAGQTSILETLGRVHVASLSPEGSLEVEFLLPWETTVFSLKAFK